MKQVQRQSVRRRRGVEAVRAAERAKVAAWVAYPGLQFYTFERRGLAVQMLAPGPRLNPRLERRGNPPKWKRVRQWKPIPGVPEKAPSWSDLMAQVEYYRTVGLGADELFSARKHDE